MAILRKINKQKYTTVLHSITTDTRLSLKDLGLLVKLLSLPDNWDFSEKGLEKILGHDGQTSIRTAIKNLEKYGYLKRTRARGENGKMAGVEWYVFEEPELEQEVEKPHLENPNLVNPNLVNQPQYNINKYNTKKLNTNVLNKSTHISKKVGNAENEKSVVEDSNVKKSKRESFDEIIERYANGNERLELLLKQLLQIRFAKKRVTTNVVLNQLLDKLSDLAQSDRAKIKVLENSILKGYADLYELSREESEEIHWIELREMQMERPEEWEAYMQFLKKPISERMEIIKCHPEWRLTDPEAEEINEISKNRHKKEIEEY